MGQYAKAIAASLVALPTWIIANVQITDDGLLIPMTGETLGTAAAVLALVGAVYQVPNRAPDSTLGGSNG